MSDAASIATILEDLGNLVIGILGIRRWRIMATTKVWAQCYALRGHTRNSLPGRDVCWIINLFMSLNAGSVKADRIGEARAAREVGRSAQDASQGG